MPKNRKRRSARRSVFADDMAARRKHKEAMGTSSMEDRIIAGHTDVLQNVEFALIQCYRRNERIDDATIAQALECAILLEQPQNELIDGLIASLSWARQMRDDIADDIWRDAMRTVLRSVDRHSNLKPGRRDYIDFVRPLVS